MNMFKLPDIRYPQYDALLPSTKQRVKYRPMTVKEEKILLVAKEGEDQNQIFNAIQQVVTNCLIEPVEHLTIFDVEYLFLRIRIHSMSDIAKVSYEDNEDHEVRHFNIDLEKLEVKFPEEYKKIISQPLVVGDLEIVLRGPSIDAFAGRDIVNDMIAACIHKVYQKGKVGTVEHKFNEFPKEEQMAFIESLPTATYTTIRTFFESLPRLHYVIEYTNKNNNKRTITLDSLSDFFSL